jgi:hypothetical protein
MSKFVHDMMQMHGNPDAYVPGGVVQLIGHHFDQLENRIYHLEQYIRRLEGGRRSPHEEYYGAKETYTLEEFQRLFMAGPIVDPGPPPSAGPMPSTEAKKDEAHPAQSSSFVLKI